MIVIPAIDLRDGKCVRLFQGDYDQTTVFAERPADVARRWESEGARWLHIVDLDGAAKGEPVNLDVIAEIVKAAGVPVQLGGGIRTFEAVEMVLQMGVARVFLGTAAVEDESLVARATQKFGERVAVAVDAKDGLIATRGWKQRTSIPATELLSRVRDLGVSWALYTDISRDGTLTEPNFEAIEEILSIGGVSLIAAGGVSSVEHLLKLRDLGVEAAVIGKALYTGDVSLREAVEVLGPC